MFPLATMTKKKKKKQTLYRRLRDSYAIACRLAFTPVERPRRQEYCVSPVFDIVVIVLLIVLGIALLL